MADSNPGLVTIFSEALERTDPAERAAYLDEACREDTFLRQRVEALLSAHDGAGRFLEADATGIVESGSHASVETIRDPASETALPVESATRNIGTGGTITTLAGAGPTERSLGFQAGQVIAGRYALQGVLGEGGMGLVYRAEQTAPVHRLVALKLIKIGMDSRVVLARFDAERQALALMDHPNIARVYDGGTTDSGQPFFVMELVNGEPITDYCDRKRLTVQARLELFVAVCQAVQHAHQKGIIHRDLKPTNVMVTEVDGDPTPKVIDFGVAKATDYHLTDQSLGDTGAIVGTPTYMSPEQADPSSMDIDTRTDIYALGVILYELLVGSPPLDASQFKRGALLEMLRMVREVEPPRPSTKVSTADELPNIAASRAIDPTHLKKLLRGDLDWIVMKSLEKDRTRRYDTANAFAADVLHHLAFEPVQAAPPSRAYRLRKFLRKHRGAVIAASLVLLAMLGGLAAVAVVQIVANNRLAASLYRETKANNDLNAANAELLKSRAAVQARYDLALDAMKTFHTGVSEDFLLKEDQFKDLRNRLLKSAADFYGKLGALLGKETDFASRRALDQANFELARLTFKVGRVEDALAADRAVLAAREALAIEPGAPVKVKLDVGNSLTWVGILLQMTGKRVEGLATLRRSESLLAALAVDNAEARGALAFCRTLIGQLLSGMGTLKESMAAYKQARADQEALAAAPGDSKEARRDLARTVYMIGMQLYTMGRMSEAEAELRSALAISQKLADENPADAGVLSDLAWKHIGLGHVTWMTGKLSEAEAHYRKTLAIYQKLADDNPAVTAFRIGQRAAHFQIGYLLIAMGRPKEAEAELRAALAIDQKMAGDNPAATELRVYLASDQMKLGILLLQMGKPEAAEAECRTSVAILGKLAEDNPAVTLYPECLAPALNHLGDVARSLGRAAEAKRSYDRTIALMVPRFEAKPTNFSYRHVIVSALRRRGQTLRELGDPAGAAAEIRRAIGLCEGLLPRAEESLFEAACCHAALAGLAGLAGSGVSAAEGKEEAARAMEWLGRAIASGYRNANQLRIESALDPLRSREDFRLMMMDLTFPEIPFSP